MKGLILALSGLAFGILVYSCSPKTNPGTGTANQTLSDKIDATVSNWESLSDEGSERAYEIYHSWVPERGVRGRYHYAKSYLSKELIEGIVGEKAFLSGPHSEGVNFTSETAFGHYNPKFVTELKGDICQGIAEFCLRQKFPTFL